MFEGGHQVLFINIVLVDAELILLNFFLLLLHILIISIHRVLSFFSLQPVIKHFVSLLTTAYKPQVQTTAATWKEQ